jgi:hypothetical protein
VKAKEGQESFVPFEGILASVRKDRTTRWAEVEPAFVDCIELFDDEYMGGRRSSGWYQAKARYFNDVIVALLENLCGRSMTTRQKKRSHLFTEIDIDVCYPSSGELLMGAEVKALGAPPHPGNKMKGRPASQDIHKRVREVAFTSIDVKAAYAPLKKIASFQDWVDTTTPAYASFWAIRANDTSDLNRIRTTLSSLRHFCNGVGALVYMPSHTPTSYRVEHIHELAIDRALRDLGQRIASN